ncbi:MAG TPA: S9 family peptidase [Caulobacteraceae bacterium]
MRAFFIAGLLALTLPAAAMAADPPVKHYSLEQLMASDGYGVIGFSPDGKKLLVHSAKTGIGNIYVMPAHGGALAPITTSTKEVIGGIGYFPHDERILYTSDHGGDELNHIFVRDPDGSVHDITPGAKLKAKFVGWSPDGKSFFVVTNERDPRYFDLYRYAADGYGRELLFTNDKGYQVEAVSPDGNWVGVSRIYDNATTYAYLYNVATKQLTPMTPETQGVINVPRAFARDGSAVYYTTDRGAEFQYLVRQDLKTGAQQTILKLNWDVEGAHITRDGRYLVTSVDEDARSTLRLFDARTLKPLRTPDTGHGSVGGFAIADNSSEAALVEEDGDTPGDLYEMDLASGRKTRLLKSLADDVNPADLVRGEVVRFKSYDGVVVPGILYRPHQPGDVGGKYAAMISVHGGPGDESSIEYKPLVQYLVNNGYVVYEINNRGSRGSGRTFNHLDDHKHGDADLDDVVAAKDMLAERADVDVNKIAIQGQSYGGYMALAGVTFRPDAFAAGIDMYGISDWTRLLPNTPPWWDDLRRYMASEMGDWKTEGDYLRAISPSYHAERIKRPLLVLQGANDPRVKPVEAQDIVAKVRANGVPVEYVEFPDEGHGFRKKANQAVAYETIKKFLDTYVKSPPAKKEGDDLSQ